tara:strand:- start:3579 stop:4553 length:975 start_codon:yes stop_codon:yes gene_type:complete
MASPTNSLPTQRGDLADSFYEFDLENQNRQYIGDQVFPVVEVSSQSGQFGILPVEELLQDRAVERAPHSGYSRGDFTFDTVNYSTKELGCEAQVDDRENTMYSSFFSASMIATSRAFNAVMGQTERNVADAVMNTSTWTGSALTSTADASWLEKGTDVIGDVEKAARKIYDNSGLWPNTIVMSRKIFRAIRANTAIIDRSKGQDFQDVRATTLNERAMALIFDVDKVLVGGAARNSANEGAEASISSIWNDDRVMVCVTANTPDFKEPCIGRQFHWSADGSDHAGVVEQYRDENVRSEIFRVRRDATEVILYKEAGHLLTNCNP